MYKQGAAQAQGYKDPKGDQGPKDQEKGRGGRERSEGVGKGKARMHKHAHKDADGSLCIAGAATSHAVEHGVPAWSVLPTHTYTHILLFAGTT